MSIKTWKKEFYKKSASKVSKKDALDHSILKWKGALKSNLKKHGLIFDTATLIAKTDYFKEDPSTFDFSMDTCALCQHYIVKNNHCIGCPLFELDGIECYVYGGPFSKFLVNDDPKPMIKELKRAKKFFKE